MGARQMRKRRNRHMRKNREMEFERKRSASSWFSFNPLKRINASTISSVNSNNNNNYSSSSSSISSGDLRPNKPQLVILDHGLYRSLSPYLRVQYARLWRGLIRGDEEEIKQASLNMAVPEDKYHLWASIVTTKSWEQIAGSESNGQDRLISSTSKADRSKARKSVQKFAFEINDLLLKIPRELLLILKTNDCLRNVERKLLVNQPSSFSASIRITARYTQGMCRVCKNIFITGIAFYSSFNNHDVCNKRFCMECVYWLCIVLICLGV
jgi:hypothetical protein